MNFLSTQERDQLKHQHKRERDKRVCDRIKAILLYDEGWSSQQIAKVLLITDQAVRNHIEEYKTSKNSNKSGWPNTRDCDKDCLQTKPSVLSTVYIRRIMYNLPMGGSKKGCAKRFPLILDAQGSIFLETSI